MKILVTGFNPFGGDAVNPSRDAVFALPDEMAGHRILKYELPTEFDGAGKRLAELVEFHRPHRVLCVGVSGRDKITPERVAINLRDASIPDNAGRKPADEPVFADGPAAYFATINVKKALESLKNEGIPAAISDTAGTFVCNNTMYTALHLQHTRFPEMKCGFLHVPQTPEQNAGKASPLPTMEPEIILKGLTAVLHSMIDGE